ncbi:MAG: hypothetical protein ACJAXY_001643 [Nonlabens sp.]|jgi:hypothetical protein
MHETSAYRNKEIRSYSFSAAHIENLNSLGPVLQSLYHATSIKTIRHNKNKSRNK